MIIQRDTTVPGHVGVEPPRESAVRRAPGEVQEPNTLALPGRAFDCAVALCAAEEDDDRVEGPPG